MLSINRKEWTAVVGFMSVGLVIGYLGPVLNIAAEELQFDADRIGLLMSAYFGASMPAMAMGLIPWIQIGRSIALTIGAIMILIACVLGWMSTSFPLLISSTLTMGFGLGLYQIGVNTYALDGVAEMPEKKQAGRLTYLQFYFGIGAILSPLLVSLAVDVLDNWRLIYPMLALGGVLPLTIINAMKLTPAKAPAGSEHSGKRLSLKLSAAIWFMLVAGAVYATLEGLTFTWLPYFWDQSYSSPFVTGSFTVSLFWVFFSISRILAQLIIDHFPPKTTVLIGGGLIGATLATWVIAGNSQWASIVCIVLLATVYACMFPTIFLVFKQMLPGDASEVTALYFVFMTVVVSVTSYSIGYLVDWFGIRSIPVILLIMTFIYLAFFKLSISRHRKVTG
ncbi:MAG: MFS transporter [Opitutales bacterium]|nr:MFS transporter [Opitutales bacterium]